MRERRSSLSLASSPGTFGTGRSSSRVRAAQPPCAGFCKSERSASFASTATSCPGTCGFTSKTVCGTNGSAGCGGAGGAPGSFGSGGGASQFYAIPSYQKNETKSAGKGQRQVPDVSADADPSTGFHIIFGGHDGQAGGTSAATPLWAATVALINQDLKKKGLREVGFANPALYWMGENAARLSPQPFHDVSAGNNLGFDAAAGWDFATGWGTMDAAALDAAWIRYIKGGGG